MKTLKLHSNSYLLFLEKMRSVFEDCWFSETIQDLSCDFFFFFSFVLCSFYAPSFNGGNLGQRRNVVVTRCGKQNPDLYLLRHLIVYSIFIFVLLNADVRSSVPSRQDGPLGT